MKQIESFHSSLPRALDAAKLHLQYEEEVTIRRLVPPREDGARFVVVALPRA